MSDLNVKAIAMRLAIGERKIFRASAPVLMALVCAGVVSACNIPVFRYALERWRPDACEVLVFHDQPLTKQQERVLAAALPEGQDRGAAGKSQSGGELAGARVVRVSVDRPNPEYASILNEVSSDPEKQFPYVVVRARIGTARTVNAWHGPLTKVPEWDVFASPARAEMAKRLLGGHSVVWLMIQSPDEERNLTARRLLDAELDRLSGTVQLPEGIGLPGSELHSEVPLLVKFSVVEIARDDSRESFLVDLLSSFRPRAVESGEPLVIPVFGRGRALEVIPAKELNARLIEDLTVFLSGACSCQVKEQNPGFDLLFSVDWNKELFEEGFEPPAAKTIGDRRQPELLTIPPGR